MRTGDAALCLAPVAAKILQFCWPGRNHPAFFLVTILSYSQNTAGGWNWLSGAGFSIRYAGRDTSQHSLHPKC